MWNQKQHMLTNARVVESFKTLLKDYKPATRWSWCQIENQTKQQNLSSKYFHCLLSVIHGGPFAENIYGLITGKLILSLTWS